MSKWLRRVERGVRWEMRRRRRAVRRREEMVEGGRWCSAEEMWIEEWAVVQ